MPDAPVQESATTQTGRHPAPQTVLSGAPPLGLPVRIRLAGVAASAGCDRGAVAAHTPQIGHIEPD